MRCDPNYALHTIILCYVLTKQNAYLSKARIKVNLGTVGEGFRYLPERVKYYFIYLILNRYEFDMMACRIARGRKLVQN